MSSTMDESPDLRHRRTRSAQQSKQSTEKVLEELRLFCKESEKRHGAQLASQVAMQKIRQRAAELRSSFLRQLDDDVTALMDDFVSGVESVQQVLTPQVNGREERSQPRTEALPDKIFVERRSLLTDLLEIDHIRTIYHIFVAILIVFTANTFVSDVIETGHPVLDIGLIYWAFGGFQTVISTWLLMSASTIVFFALYKFWAENRPSTKVGAWDYLWLGLYVCYQLAFLVLPLRVINEHALPSASAACIAAEQTRFLMKTHAFLRGNAPTALGYAAEDSSLSGDEAQRHRCPDFSKYLYFLFIPTLVYRSEYPRTRATNWGYVWSNFAQVVACLFYLYFIFVRFCVPTFRNFNRDHVSLEHLMLSAFACMMPGTLVLIIGFFAILHSWMNAWAEITCFADRQFYRDWWNSHSFSNYYRTWNVIVHDWLYTYVYKDMYRLYGRRLRALSMASVFLLSAVFHEYILAVVFGFCYPILFVQFAGAGYLFMFIGGKGRQWNVFMWVALMFGCGILMCLYSMEWYARIRCPPVTDAAWLDYIVPRSWFCDFETVSKNDLAQ